LMKRLRLEIRGVVQGVGFRPFVHNLATSRGLSGFIRNSATGASVEVEGEDPDSFAPEMESRAPVLARIFSVSVKEISPSGELGFRILPSLDGQGSTHLLPDVATCPECLAEMADPSDRRFLYPFINCTHCGPRYSITRAVPYDRANTTMSGFVMCERCRAEYEDPDDRRFHAQPVACPECGPQAVFVKDGMSLPGRSAIRAAIEALKSGLIVAVKGIGGFHLAVDAAHAGAVQRLRLRKRKSNKAFALMAPDLDRIRLFCNVTGEEALLLKSLARPIVLLERRQGPEDGPELPYDVAPRVSTLGFMLPYTPLHTLLFHQKGEDRYSPEPNFTALVMTSGNASEEPIAKDNEEALGRLPELADAFLLHDRPIFTRADDSVVRVFSGQTLFIRRARGYVPVSLPLEGRGPHVLACGADIKNTLALTGPDFALVSQHLGDMETLETHRFFEETLDNLKHVYRLHPEVIVHDLHPGYFSTRWALGQADVPKVALQHHYAHIGSVMAAHGLREPVIGVALDGSGFGPDGTVWGGEFLLADIAGYERVARFKPVRLPGGEAAVRNPWMMALSHMRDATGKKTESFLDVTRLRERVGPARVENCFRILENARLSPLTSSAGRLFDAVSSILNLVDVNTYEGEAAMALEGIASPDGQGNYAFAWEGSDPHDIDLQGVVLGVLEDLVSGVETSVIAGRFHNAAARVVTEVVERISRNTGTSIVALSGGVFQNRLLLRQVVSGLMGLGLRCLVNTHVPPNDGGVSLGQAYLVRERMRLGKEFA